MPASQSCSVQRKGQQGDHTEAAAPQQGATSGLPPRAPSRPKAAAVAGLGAALKKSKVGKGGRPLSSSKDASTAGQGAPRSAKQATKTALKHAAKPVKAASKAETKDTAKIAKEAVKGAAKDAPKDTKDAPKLAAASRKAVTKVTAAAKGGRAGGGPGKRARAIDQNLDVPAANLRRSADGSRGTHTDGRPASDGGDTPRPIKRLRRGL